MADLNFSEVLVFSDILAGATTAGFSSVFDKPSWKKSTEAVLISMAARLISTSFPNLTGESVGLSKQQKNELVVGVLSAAVAYGMNRNVAKAVLTSISADLLAEQAFVYLGIKDTTILGSKRSATTVDSETEEKTSTSSSGIGGTFK
jgi:hypothetical protein